MRASRAPRAADKAWAELTAATEAHTRWSTELDTRRAELDQLRQHTGEALLDSPERADELAEQETRLAVRVRQAEQAVAAAASRVPPLRRKVLAERSAVLADRAARLEKVAEQRQARTDAMLAELAEWEGGAKFVPWVPTSADAELGADRLPGLPGAVGVRYKITLTETIRRAAADLRARSQQLAKTAEDGTDQQVSAALGRAVPEPSQLEREHAPA